MSQKQWKSTKMSKMRKMSENKSSRLGRYRNRNWARKNVLRSWDRDLSIGEVKWSIGRKSKWCKNQKWKRKWSFGTLYKSQLSRKKCSEQLRSRKIYWWAQKFLRGHKILKKGHHNFGFWDRVDVIFPTPKFWWFGALNGLKTSNFVLQTQFLSKICSKLMSPPYFQFLYLRNFSHFCIFTIFHQMKTFN